MKSPDPRLREKSATSALPLLCVSGGDGVELCDVVHHGRLQRDFLHEHGRGGDVLDLSLQEHFICLERRGVNPYLPPRRGQEPPRPTEQRLPI